MPTPTKGLEGDRTPGDIAERELAGPKDEPLSVESPNADAEPPKDRDREPSPPIEEDGEGD